MHTETVSPLLLRRHTGWCRAQTRLPNSGRASRPFWTMPPAPGTRRAAKHAQANQGVGNAGAASFFGSFLQENVSGHAQSASGDLATPGLGDSPPSSLSPPSSPETSDETPANPTSPKESIGDFGQDDDDVENDSIERKDTKERAEESTHLETQGEKLETGAINTETNGSHEATGETNEKHKMEINVKVEAKMAEAPAAKSGPNDNDMEDKTKTEMNETVTHADAKDVKEAQNNDKPDSSPARKNAKDKQMTRARVKLEDDKIETSMMGDDNAAEISMNTEDSEAKNAVKTEANDVGVFNAEMEQATQVNEDSKATSKAASNVPESFADDTDAKVDEEALLPVKLEINERKVHVKTEINGSETTPDAKNNDTGDIKTSARVKGDEAVKADKRLKKSPAETNTGSQHVAQVNIKSETKEATRDVKVTGNVDRAQVLERPEVVKQEDAPVSKSTEGNGKTHVNVKAKIQKRRTLGDDSDAEGDERPKVKGKVAPKHIGNTHVRSRHSTTAGVSSTSSSSSSSSTSPTIIGESMDQGRKPSPNMKRRKTTTTTTTTQLSQPTRARKRRPVAEDLYSDDIPDQRASTRVLRPRRSTSKRTVASAGSDSESEPLDSSGDDETFQPEPRAEVDGQSAASEMLDSSDEDELLQPTRRAKSNRQRATSEALDSSDEEGEFQPEQRTKRGRRETRNKEQPIVLLKVCCVPECKRKAGTKNRCAKHGGQRRCEEEGCPKQASFGGKCKSHGGGRRCKEPGCSSSAQGKMMLCIAHGGGARCQAPGCSSSARGKTKFCVTHGGGRRCQKPTCEKAAAGSTRFCILHGGGRRCQADACTSSAQGATDFCVYHGGGRRCEASACPNSAAGSTKFCKSHIRSLRWQTDAASASESANLGEA